MTFSWKRVNAILQKDFKDFSRNSAVSIIIFLPIILAAIYGRMGIDSLQVHFMTINMAFAMVGTYVQCCLIAEEKEKNTLRGLMLSPASTLEILGGKSLLTFVLTIVVVFFSAYLSEYRPASMGIVAFAIILSTLFYIGMGTLLGLVAKSVMESSVIVLPVIGVFTMGSFITAWTEKYPILKVAEFLPNIQLFELAEAVEQGAGFVQVFSELGIIGIWIVVIFALTVVVYRKRMVD
ncbi:ABC transporter permease [Psychrobacillus lasiicapitis]|uniref:ABC transporter permease n=1 Tax=Psychrobacillus lasiicapitis TaxID=1636719 RepID=A0A544STE7_9BACI|nr:ABC transporter permease [Psychrobacillus lasiicapitis]TQR08479.1 ABC transporter permease [Psychrobacillus lasiicapitis]GGA15571.1 ABC transporter permease [Psychrobacillus lasiicapitis]